MSAPHLLVVGASFTTGNMGVSALTAGAIEAALATWPDATITLLDYAKTPTRFRYVARARPVTVELLNIRFSKRIVLPNNIALLIAMAAGLALLPRRLARRLRERNATLSAIGRADLVVGLSGGDSFSDIYGLGRFFYCYLPLLLIQLLGKPLVLLPQTFGPYRSLVARVLARYLLNRTPLLYARDRRTLRDVRSFLGPRRARGRLRLCHDVAFAVNPVRPRILDLSGLEERRRPQLLVGLNVSGLLWMGGYTRVNQFRLARDYPSLVHAVLDDLIRARGATVLLVPHVFSDGGADESDQAICERLYHEGKSLYVDRLYLARGRYDQSEIKYVIGLCDLFVGARMHACIAALSQHIPTVALAYSGKFIGVFEAIDMAACVADLRTADTRTVLAVLAHTWVGREDVRRHLAATLPGVRDRIASLYPDVAAGLSMRVPRRPATIEA